MSANSFKRMVWESSIGEIRRGSLKYVSALIKVMEGLEEKEKSDIRLIGKELVYIGYAMGVMAGKSSDAGIEGFTLLLNGIKASLDGEDRKEKMVFALWDKNADLHTSEEGYNKMNKR